MLKWYLIIGITFGATVLCCWKIHRVVMDKISITHQKELAELSETLISSCRKNAQQTQEATHALEVSLNNTRVELARLRNRQATCVVLDGSPAGPVDGPSNNSRLPPTYGVTSSTLYEFAADAEETGLKLDACQRYIQKVYHGN